MSFNGCGKDTHGKQFPGDAMSHFCLCECEIILKFFYFFFFSFLYFAAVAHNSFYELDVYSHFGW